MDIRREQRLFLAGKLTVNEIRRKHGFPPLPEGDIRLDRRFHI